MIATIHPAILIATLTAAISTGCVSPKEQQLRAQEAGYRSALKALKPNCTRAELDRQFPPIAVAKAHDVQLLFPKQRAQLNRKDIYSDGVPAIRALEQSRFSGSSPAQNLGNEIHPLDAEFYLFVRYEYRHYERIHAHRQNKPSLSYDQAGRSTLSPADIDALLFPRRPNFRVHPDPRDRVIETPWPCRRSEYRTTAYDPTYPPNAQPQYPGR